MIYGWREFGTAVDIWAMGLAFSEMAGEVFRQDSMRVSNANTVSYMVSSFKRLGTPAVSCRVDWPLFPVEPPEFPPGNQTYVRIGFLFDSFHSSAPAGGTDEIGFRNASDGPQI